MRFMMIVKATRDTEAGKMPEEKLIAAMAAYHEELVKAGRPRVHEAQGSMQAFYIRPILG